jgi:hypothetical protein
MVDKVYYIENGTVREAEVVKLARDFVTLRYRYRNPNTSPRETVYHYGGLRLRSSKVFESREDAEKAAKN